MYLDRFFSIGYLTAEDSSFSLETTLYLFKILPIRVYILFSICIGFVFTMREFTWNSKKLTNISTDNIHQNNTLVECKVNNVVFNMMS